jgi:hypothetical protein
MAEEKVMKVLIFYSFLRESYVNFKKLRKKKHQNLTTSN